MTSEKQISLILEKITDVSQRVEALRNESKTEIRDFRQENRDNFDTVWKKFDVLSGDIIKEREINIRQEMAIEELNKDITGMSKRFCSDLKEFANRIDVIEKRIEPNIQEIKSEIKDKTEMKHKLALISAIIFGILFLVKDILFSAVKNFFLKEAGG